jgi:hypothetical protein
MTYMHPSLIFKTTLFLHFPSTKKRTSSYHLKIIGKNLRFSTFNYNGELQNFRIFRIFPYDYPGLLSFVHKFIEKQKTVFAIVSF